MLTAFLIMLREGFEGALVVAIVYAYLRRLGRPDLLTSMWTGVAGAAVLSVASGVVIHLTVQDLAGAARLRVFAAISAFAVAVLTWMIFWMRKQARAIKGALQRSVDEAIATGGSVRTAILLVAFFAVAREGLEAALFMVATATTENGGAVLVGALLGLALAGVLGYLVVVAGKRLPMARFFQVTGVVLVVFAAGLVSRTVLYLQSAGDLPSLWASVYDLTGQAWLTQRTEVGKFLAAMFGWDPRPSIEQVLAYLAYLLPVGWLFLRGSGGPRRPAAAPSDRATAVR